VAEAARAGRWPAGGEQDLRRGSGARLAACGQREFGENYLQEALENRRGSPICRWWHFIGPIQSNKTRAIAKIFSWVHGIDRLKIAERLSAQRPPGLPPLQICIEVNVSGEASKGGVSVAELPALAEAVAILPGLQLRGLMAIPAPTPDPAAQRAAFRRVREAYEDLNARGHAPDTCRWACRAIWRRPYWKARPSCVSALHFLERGTSMHKVSFIGGGNMAAAIIGGLIASGTQPADIEVVEINADARAQLAARFGVVTHSDISQARLHSLIVLAVKPQSLPEVATALAARLDGQLVVSIAAGVRVADLARWLGGHQRRAPCRIRRRWCRPGLPACTRRPRSTRTRVRRPRPCCVRSAGGVGGGRAAAGRGDRGVG
jgi:hypothetical protein